jgi:hypothetical protein
MEISLYVGQRTGQVVVPRLRGLGTGASSPPLMAKSRPNAEDADMDPIGNEHRNEFSRALGEAVIRIWGELPQEIQHDLFEAAISAQGEPARHRLAEFLHHHHPRTEATVKARAMVEPDSLGG